MKLFLQGPSGVGKSYLLQETLASHVQEIAGFTVQRLIENDVQVGFRVAGIENEFPQREAVYTQEMTGVFILQRQRNVFALEKAILRVEEESRRLQCKLVFLDEIGGIELTSNVFMDSLIRILSSGKPCCGVLKSQENLVHTASILKLGEEYADCRSKLAAKLEEDGELFTVTAQNRAELRDYLATRFRTFFL